MHVCYYHAGCPDGFGAAWAIWRAWGSAGRYAARGHDDAIDAEAHLGATVVFADIAPPNGALAALATHCASLTVLDHHVSSRDRFAAEPDLVAQVAALGHRVHFDLDHSGAVLAWQHFHPSEPVPELLRYVEDQDLWRWALPRSREVNAAVGAQARSFSAWEKLAATPREALAEEGAPIVQAQDAQVRRALESAHLVRLGELELEAVNAVAQRSLIGHELATRARYGAPCGLVYRIVGRRVDCSVYSVGSFDVSALAAGYGGGGHRNAAGFSVDLGEWLRSFV